VDFHICRVFTFFFSSYILCLPYFAWKTSNSFFSLCQPPYQCLHGITSIWIGINLEYFYSKLYVELQHFLTYTCSTYTKSYSTQKFHCPPFISQVLPTSTFKSHYAFSNHNAECTLALYMFTPISTSSQLLSWAYKYNYYTTC